MCTVVDATVPMRSFIAAVLPLLASSPATASGGLWCDADDGPARIEIQGGVTHGMGGPLFNFAGTLAARDETLPADLRKTAFDRSHVPQYWLDGKELRLLLYRERAADRPHGYVELTIITHAIDESSYEGRYELKLFDADSSNEGRTWKFEGKISCGAE